MISEKQFELIFRSHFADMCNLAFTVVKDSEVAHDVVQQVFINIWNRRDEISFDTTAVAYLRRSTINLSLNYVEKERKIVRDADLSNISFDGDTVDSRTDFLPDEVENAVKRAVMQLPGKCQAVFSLSRFQGMNNKEIADELGISVKAVEKHIGKALRELRVSLKPYMNLIENFLIFGVGIESFKLFL